MKLLTHDDWVAKSTIDDTTTVARRSLVRVKQAAAPMPPANGTPLTADELTRFEQWVNAGALAGACNPDPDAGMPPDAGPPPLTCLSGTFKPKPTPAMPGGSPEMAPGWACRACHMGQN